MTTLANPFSAPEPWEAVANGYAAEAHWIMGPFSQRAIELAAPPEQASVLDVACGPGTLALAVAPRVARVDALDFSGAMLAELVRKAESLGLSNVYVREGDGQALPFEGGTFDAAFSMFGLMFFPDRARGFRELLRVLRPGAPAVVSSWAPVDQSSLMSLMFGALRAADPERAAPRRDLLSLENPEVFEAELRAAGFDDVQVQAHTHAVRVNDASSVWESMVRSSAPIVMLRDRLGEAVWSAQAALAQRYIEEQLANGPQELTTTAYLGSGRKPRSDA